MVLLVVILELRLNLALVIGGSKVPGAGKEPDCLQVILVCLVVGGLGSCGQRCIAGSGLGLGIGVSCRLRVNELQFDVGKRKLKGIAESRSACGFIRRIHHQFLAIFFDRRGRVLLGHKVIHGNRRMKERRGRVGLLLPVLVSDMPAGLVADNPF